VASDLTGQLPVASRRGNKYILITVYRGYIHYTPQKSKSASDYVSSFASILAFFTAHSLPLPSLIVDNETSLECREYFLSQRLPVTFVPPQILISIFSSTHPDFPDDLWDRLLPYAEITLNIMRPWRPDPSLSAWSGLHRLPYDYSTYLLSTRLANSALPSPAPKTATLGPLTGIALLSLAPPLPTTAANGSMSLPPALSASPSPSLTFPYPYFTSPHPIFPQPLPPTHLPPVIHPLSMARI
jgi:hypothetical protein